MNDDFLDQYCFQVVDTYPIEIDGIIYEVRARVEPVCHRFLDGRLDREHCVSYPQWQVSIQEITKQLSQTPLAFNTFNVRQRQEFYQKVLGAFLLKYPL